MNDIGMMLTPHEAAQRLALTVRRVHQLGDQGRLKMLRTRLGRLFDPDDVERFARERQGRKATAG